MASNEEEEEEEVLQKTRAVFSSEEWVDIPGFQAQDRKVNRVVKVAEGLMHNLVKDGMLMSEVNRLLYTGSYVVANF